MRFRKRPPKKPGFYWVLWPFEHGNMLLPAELEDISGLRLATIIGLEDLLPLSDIAYWGDRIRSPRKIKTPEPVSVEEYS